MLVAFSSSKTFSYTISTPVYEGPLDLLLQLIEHEELDITSLSLARVTDQYLNYLHNLENEATAEISAFLVIAAKLLQIKSAALLPHSVSNIDIEENVGKDLVYQLLEYKRYKKVSEHLLQRENNEQHTFLRLTTPSYIEPGVDLSGVTIKELVVAAIEAFSRSNSDLLHSSISKTKITIREKIQIIAKALQKRKKIGFWSLFRENRSRIDIVVTFLALLELVKQNFVKAYQVKPFDEIEIEKYATWDSNETIELEFEE
jgi:segregation and condensation protein A